MTTSVNLTWQEFLKESMAFLDLTKKLNDEWELYKKNEAEGNAFLKCKRKLRLRPSNKSSITTDHLEHSKWASGIEDNDEAAVSAKTQLDVYQLEYHILYSISYQVPVIYFRIQSSDGSLVELEDVWQMFAGNENGEAMSTKTRSELLTMLTQMEHPVLFKPYYGIHPCKTAELLAQMPQSKNRVLTFISLMGPFVHLNLDNRYGLSCD